MHEPVRLRCHDHPEHPRGECPACDRQALAGVARDLGPLLELLGLPGLPLASGRHARDYREQPRKRSMAQILLARRGV